MKPKDTGLSQKNKLMIEFKYLEKYSKETKIPKKNLVDAYLLEKEFHERIEKELVFEKRQKLYNEIYQRVHKIYGKDKANIENRIKIKNRFIWLFRKELKNKSVLDIGCGDGSMLMALSKKGISKKLTGVDISPINNSQHNDINFIRDNILTFRIESRFDVVVLDNVYEHISPLDKDSLLKSISKVLTPNGKVILWLPNRNFGPSDVTRIVDLTYSGKTPAMGTHLNESTYTEVIEDLKRHGFSNFKTILPFRRIMYLFSWLRIPSNYFISIERNEALLKILKKIKINGKCFFRFDVIVIGHKVNEL